ncbi:MAG TPA: TonB-dependent receptor plug domain-containing protein [Gemmatimonadaceae bacterium]
MYFLLALTATLSLTSTHRRMSADTVPNALPAATIVGVVTDSLGRAIAGGDVSVDGIRMAPTDGFGSFVVEVTANRRHEIQIRSLGYSPGTFSIVAGPGETQTAQIPLAAIANSIAALLPGVRINVHQDEVDRYDPGLAGFAHRRETLGGSFVNAEELKERGYPPLSVLLHDMPGVTVATSHVGGLPTAAVSMRGSGCVQVYLDGHPASLSGGDNNVDNYINTHELAAIEVYPSSAWVPVQFATSIAASCGTIVLWTAEALTH